MRKDSKLIYIGVFLILFITASCKAEDTSPEKTIKGYLRNQLSVDIDDYYTVNSFYHPDIAFPPGENQLLHIVSPNFKIVEIKKEKLDINLMDPHLEEITIVSVKFETYCDIVNGEYRDSDFSIRNYYLSVLDDKYYILDFTNPTWKTVTLDKTINWINRRYSSNTKWSSLKERLLQMNENP